MSQYKDIPQATDQRNVSQNDILTNYRYLSTPINVAAGVPQGLLPVDHFASGDNVANPTDGFHKQISFQNRAVPANLTNSINGQNSSCIEYAAADGTGRSQIRFRNGSLDSPMTYLAAMALFNGTTGAIVGVTHNINNPGGIVRNAVGNYTINFSVAQPNANYVIHAMAQSTSGAQIYGISYTNKLAASFVLKVFRIISGGGGTVADDPDQISVTVFGIF